MSDITRPDNVIKIPLKDMPREVFYCPGAKVEMFTGPDGTKFARLVRLGHLKGKRLNREMARKAREMGVSPEHYHLLMIRIATAKAEGRWPADISKQTAILNGAR